MKKNILLSILNSFGILLCLTFFIFTSAVAQSPNWIWAKSAQGPGGHGDGWSIDTDNNGNVLATGFFDGQITFGSTVLTSAGGYDIFIVKYDPSGNLLWAKREGNTVDDKGLGISTDGNGNVFVTGSFEDTTITIGSTVLPNYGNADIFVAKYDASGNVLWAKGAGLDFDDLVAGISTDPNGNAVITGHFRSDFLAFGSSFLTNSWGAPHANFFIAKYDPSGNVLWAHSAGGTGGGGDDAGSGIATDQNNNILVAGRYSSTSITFGSTVLTNSTGNAHFFVVKYDPLGNVLWVGDGTVSQLSAGYSISTDAANNVLATGVFQGPSISFNSTVLNGGSVFIVKYDSSGNVLWARSSLTGGGGWSHSLSTDAAGNSYISGYHNTTITFGTITLITPLSTNFPMFVVKYDPGGNAVCAESFPSGGYLNNGINVDQSGNAYVIADFDLNPFIIGNDTLTLTGAQAVFIAKFTCGATAISEFNDQSAGVRIFPNPFTDELIISGLQDYNFTGEIKINDVFGRIIYSQKLLSSNCTVPTAHWHTGVYFLHLVSDDGERIVKKMVKE